MRVRVITHRNRLCILVFQARAVLESLPHYLCDGFSENSLCLKNAFGISQVLMGRNWVHKYKELRVDVRETIEKLAA